MPAVTRQGDSCTGHDACPPRSSTGGSPDVLVNGIPAHRQGDSWGAHGCPVHPSHGSVLASGSSTVFANGKAIGRIGDPVACGGSAASGSPNVFAGG
jgi:uncharacterized Zn-binding protein involved in type VI secretion